MISAATSPSSACWRAVISATACRSSHRGFVLLPRSRRLARSALAPGAAGRRAALHRDRYCHDRAGRDADRLRARSAADRFGDGRRARGGANPRQPVVVPDRRAGSSSGIDHPARVPAAPGRIAIVIALPIIIAERLAPLVFAPLLLRRCSRCGCSRRWLRHRSWRWRSLACRHGNAAAARGRDSVRDRRCAAVAFAAHRARDRGGGTIHYGNARAPHHTASLAAAAGLADGRDGCQGEGDARCGSRSGYSCWDRGSDRSSGSRSASSDHHASSSFSSAGWMTVLSHSPTDIPERRAASRAAARASGLRPLKFHGPPDLIPTSKPHEEQDPPVVSG